MSLTTTELRAKLSYALAEADLVRVSPIIFENAELEFAMLLRIYLADKPYIEVAELEYEETRSTGVVLKCFQSNHPLDEDITNRLYTWLRGEEYPVDRIVRLKRLRALISRDG